VILDKDGKGNCKDKHDYYYLILWLQKHIYHFMRHYSVLLPLIKLIDGDKQSTSKAHMTVFICAWFWVEDYLITTDTNSPHTLF